MNRVVDKVIIVTGGATGIGQATCFLLAREGATIALVAEDVAYGILYLASDEAKFVTASELVIDGGICGGFLR